MSDIREIRPNSDEDMIALRHQDEIAEEVLERRAGLPTPYYEEPGITIYHADCRDILPHLPKVDLVLTDPPYGIRLDTDNSRFSGGTAGNIAKRGNGVGSCGGVPIQNDDKPFDPTFLLDSGRQQIIWGWSHFADKLPRGTCLVWIKRYDEAFGSFLSDAEVAWMSRGHGVYCRRDLSNNAIANERAHPTQKPLALMAWCLGFFPSAQAILDPFMGSGTTLVAARSLGRRCIGIEIEERYCEIAVNRLRQRMLEFTGPLHCDKMDVQEVLPYAEECCLEGEDKRGHEGEKARPAQRRNQAKNCTETHRTLDPPGGAEEAERNPQAPLCGGEIIDPVEGHEGNSHLESKRGGLSVLEGREADRQERVHLAKETGTPQCELIRDGGGASTRDVGVSGASTSRLGDSSSQERHQGRQPDREPCGGQQEDAQGTGDLPPLSETVCNTVAVLPLEPAPEPEQMELPA